MSRDEIISKQTAALNAARVALTLFAEANNIAKEENQNVGELEDVRVESIEAPLGDNDKWIVVIGYKEKRNKDEIDTNEKNVFADIYKNRRFFKIYVLEKDTYQLISVKDA